MRVIALFAAPLAIAISLTVLSAGDPKSDSDHGIKWEHLTSKNGDLPIPPGSLEQTMCLIADLDKDGRNDFVIGCRQKAPALVWYRNTKDGWKVYTIESELIPIEAGGVILDVNGDGFPDIIAGEDWTGKRVFWWENPGKDYDPKKPWKRHVVKNGGENMHHDQIAGDFCGEGKPQLVFWNQFAKKLFLAHIPKDPTNEPWPYKEIWSDGGGAAEGLASGDIDGDGKLDLLGAGRWFKHEKDDKFTAYEIDDAQREARIAVGDFNEDGKLDVVMVPGDHVGRLKWYERKSKDAPKSKEDWIAHDLLGVDVKHGHSLAVADFDGDGHLDIFCAEMRKWTDKDDNPTSKMWIFFGDGKGNFTKVELSTGDGIHEAKVGDLDGDGRPDIVAKPYNWDTPRIDLWLNRKK